MPYLVGYLTPQDYGAVADGVTDDTTAIQAAITAAQATGKAVFFPATSASYLLNSAGLTVSANDVVLLGESGTGSTLTIGASFVGTAAVTITGNNCQVNDLAFFGASTTTTSNPAADAIKISGARRTRVNRCTFYYINGWCVEALATSGSSTTNPLGTQLGQLFMNQCAAGLHFQGNTTQTWAMNCSVTDVQSYLGGVTTGAYANLDVIKIEDAWDVLLENVIAWMSNGSGSALHIKGNCAATFARNLDALGPSSGTGANVLIEDSVNGSPQNVQFSGGVIQQGNVGLRVTGGATHVHVNGVRVISNTTHGVSIEGTGSPVHLRDVFFSLNGQGAAGNNYDINWSSATALGSVTDCYFASPITSIGVAGVQQSVNITANQDVSFLNVVFAGTGASSANWFTNTPAAVLESGASFNFPTNLTFNNGFTVSGSSGASAAAAAATTAWRARVTGDAVDRWSCTGDGTLLWGSGAASRDTNLYRSAANVLTTDDNMTVALNATVGGTASLGDNGVGEIQLHNYTTPPTSPPTNGTIIYSQSAQPIPLMAYDVNGSKRSIVDAFVRATADQNVTSSSQTASTYLVLGLETSSTYLMEAGIIAQNTTGVFTPSWTGPTGATMQWNDTTGSLDYSSTINATNNTYAANAGVRLIFLRGILFTAGTSGNLTFTYSASAGTSTVFTNSWVRLTKVK